MRKNRLQAGFLFRAVGWIGYREKSAEVAFSSAPDIET